ncbi:MAG: nicotinate phosphoribosyltransferase, partial [Oscillospiraceae bacterium]
KPLLIPIFIEGKRVYDSPRLTEIRGFCTEQLDTLWDEVKRLEYPHQYYVDYSKRLWDEQRRLLEEI